jgi:hypothetical protein
MKIKTDNHVKINAALDQVNGKPLTHTFTAGELEKRGYAIAAHLLKFLPLKGMKGITGQTYSGAPVARAYKYTRVGNCADFIINAKGEVFITSITKVTLQERNGGGTFFQISGEQQKSISLRAVIQASSL